MSSTAFFAGAQRAVEVLLLVVRDGEQVIRGGVRIRARVLNHSSSAAAPSFHFSSCMYSCALW